MGGDVRLESQLALAVFFAAAFLAGLGGAAAAVAASASSRARRRAFSFAVLADWAVKAFSRSLMASASLARSRWNSSRAFLRASSALASVGLSMVACSPLPDCGTHWHMAAARNLKTPARQN